MQPFKCVLRCEAMIGRLFEAVRATVLQSGDAFIASHLRHRSWLFSFASYNSSIDTHLLRNASPFPRYFILWHLQSFLYSTHTLSCPTGSSWIQRRFLFFVQLFEALERTSQGSESTQTFFFGRKLMCNAILQHFKITLFCDRINCPRIPFALFSSRIHLSNSSLFVGATSSRTLFRATNSCCTTMNSPAQTPMSISTTTL